MNEQTRLEQMQAHLAQQKAEFADHQRAVCSLWTQLEALEKCSFRLVPAPDVPDNMHSQRYGSVTPRSHQLAAGIAEQEEQIAQLRGRLAQGD